MKNLRDATKPFSDGEDLGVEVIETTISPAVYSADGVSPHVAIPAVEPDNELQDSQPLSGFGSFKKSLSDNWEKIKGKVVDNAGPLSHGINLPTSAALVVTGVNDSNPVLILSGGLTIAADLFIMRYGSRKQSDGGPDPQDGGTLSERLTSPKKYPYEFATNWGELLGYGTLLVGGAASETTSLQVLAAEGAAQVIGVGLINVPEKEKAPDHYTMNIPHVPRFVNDGLESIANSKFGKKVADYIVTKPAAASNFLPKITFGAFTATSVTEMAQAGAVSWDQGVYLVGGWASVLLYDLVRKRQKPAEPNEGLIVPEGSKPDSVIS